MNRAFVILIVLAAGLSVGLMRLGPEPIGTSQDLFGDTGVNYLVADQLAQGKRLYQDLQYPYGPIPAYLFCGFTRLFGNSPASYCWFQWLGSLVLIALATLLLLRYCHWSEALVVGTLGLVPLAMSPGCLIGGANHSAYIPLERLSMVGLALLWKPPGERTFRDSLLLGLILGLWQGAKVGGALLGLGVLLAFDVTVTWLGRTSRAGGWSACRQSLWVVLVFALSEAVRWVIFLALLSPEVARDCIWPVFARDAYRTMSEQERACPFVQPVAFRYFLGWHLVPVVGLLAAPVAALLSFAADRRPVEQGSARPSDPRWNLLLLPAFYWAAWLSGYLGHQYTYYHYAWCLLFGVVALPMAVGWLRVPLLVLLLLPQSLLLMGVSVRAWTERDHRETIQLGGYRFATLSPAKTRIDATRILHEVEHLDSQRLPLVLVLYCGGGFHHFTGLPLPTRHMWVIPHYVRPHERDSLRERFRDLNAILYVDPEGNPHSRTLDLRHLLPAVVGEEITAELVARNDRRVEIGEACVLFPLKK